MLIDEYAPWLIAGNISTVILLLVLSRISPWKIFLLSTCFLYLSGLLTLEKALAGFSNQSLLVVVLLFLVSIPLERTSLVRRAIAFIVTGSVRRSTIKLSLLAGGISTVVNNTAVVAALLGPLKKQKAIAPSKLLLSLSYASIIGGTVTLIGTSTNLIINGFVQQAGYPSLGFFEFSAIGIPVAICCLITIALLAPKVLPDHDVLLDSVAQDYFLEREVQGGSALAGRSVLENGLRRLERIFLVEVIRSDRVVAPVSPEFVLEEGDVLIFSGDVTAIELLDSYDGLAVPGQSAQAARDNMREVIVSPSAGVVGHTIKAVDFRARFDAAVVAVRRGNERLKGGLGQLVLKAGDALVLAAGPAFQRRKETSSDFILIGEVDVNRLLTPREEIIAYTGLAAIVALGITGFVPLLKGLVVLLAIFVVLKLLPIETLKARFPFELMVVISGALALSHAVFESGLGEVISNFAHSHLSGVSALQALVGLFLLTWILTESVTNNAAAAILFPIAMAVSSQWSSDHMPFVMAVAFGASASFLSPYGYQTNLMVYSAGNYKVANYVKFGLPVLATYCVTSLVSIAYYYNL